MDFLINFTKNSLFYRCEYWGESQKELQTRKPAFAFKALQRLFAAVSVVAAFTVTKRLSDFAAFAAELFSIGRFACDRGLKIVKPQNRDRFYRK
ncbi:MAG: hypothetical protein LBU73_08315 [Helicobacteraceae bacterium]|nr:hypothetical protein [Helicobacteraceae bacterium]